MPGQNAENSISDILELDEILTDAVREAIRQEENTSEYACHRKLEYPAEVRTCLISI